MSQSPTRLARLASDVPIGAVLTRNLHIGRWYCAGSGSYSDGLIRRAVDRGVCEVIESTGQVQRVDHQARRGQP